MDNNSLFWIVLKLLGGLAFFIFALKTLISNLQAAGGRWMRETIRWATRGRWVGLGLGTAMGTLLQSNAGVFLIIGFLHAGLLTLPQAIAPIAGANLGTTLALQLIAFDLGEFYYIPIILGVLIMISIQRRPWNEIGQALIGFGFLFMSMKLMSGTFAPHKELLRSWLSAPHDGGFSAQIIGIATTTIISALLQSRSATMGLLFALIGAGAFHSLEPIFPYVLGAQIGTCSTGIIGSIGTSIEARRGAVTHLLFNLIGVAIALAIQPYLIAFIQTTSPDLIRQAANLQTAIAVITALLLMPLRRPFVGLVRLVTWTRKSAPPSSYLDDAELPKPEQAIYLSVRELQRVAIICAQTFRLNAEIMFRLDRKKLLTIRRNEDAVDDIQNALKRYLQDLTRRYLSRRQSIMIQHLNRCMIDIERIGDHNENIADLTEQRLHTKGAAFSSSAQQSLFTLFESADRVLQLVIQSLNPDNVDFQAMARDILQARDEYSDKSLEAKALFSEKIINHEWSPIVGIFLSDYVAAFDRIVRHSKMIALAESQPYFWIKRRKLDRLAPAMPGHSGIRNEPTDFLDKLQEEGFI
ncbi:MAG: Na/Pi cotransporter family protein [Kiritimatiellae bacterium]|nr:Na/Pi cotransporter family protein [Kiritimatiellia bacterium]MCO5067129.1 Na/Pi symporter [Kiritimatiellia bacterium]